MPTGVAEIMKAIPVVSAMEMEAEPFIKIMTDMHLPEEMQPGIYLMNKILDLLAAVAAPAARLLAVVAKKAGLLMAEVRNKTEMARAVAEVGNLATEITMLAVVAMGLRIFALSIDKNRRPIEWRV